MTDRNVTISGSPDALAELFGGDVNASQFDTASAIPVGMARVQYGSETRDIDIDEYENLASAFGAQGPSMGLPADRVVTYSVDGELVPANSELEVGVLYVATTKHDDKG